MVIGLAQQPPLPPCLTPPNPFQFDHFLGPFCFADVPLCAMCGGGKRCLEILVPKMCVPQTSG